MWTEAYLSPYETPVQSAVLMGDPVNAYDPLGLWKYVAGSCSGARRQAELAGGNANFACPEDAGPVFTATGTAYITGPTWNPGYTYGPGAMPGVRPVPPAPPSGNPCGGGPEQVEQEEWTKAIKTATAVSFARCRNTTLA
jgi:hypothetical protein